MSDDDADLRKVKEALDAAGDAWQKLKSQNISKVASGNDVIDIPLPEVTLVEIPKGGCKVCGCPPDKMPMVFRGTGWCSDLHRKELLQEES